MQAPATAAIEAKPLDDPSGFEAMYRAYSAYVWAVLSRLGVEAVADAHQEVFITAYRRRDTFEAGRPLKPWLVGIARKVAFRYRRSTTRRSRKHDALMRVWGIEGGGRQEIRGRLEARDFLARFLEELPPTRREIFVRGELEGQTGREIAQTLDLGIDAVYGQLRSARAELRTRLLAVEAPPISRERVERGFALLVPHLRPAASVWATLLSNTTLVVLGAAAAVGVAVTLGVLGGSTSTPGPGGAPVASVSPVISAVEPPAGPPGAETSSERGDDRTPAHPSVTDPSRPLEGPDPPSAAPGVPGTPTPTEAIAVESAPGISDRSRIDPSTTSEVRPVGDAGEQTRRLIEVRRALLEGRPRQALAQLEAHAHDFPRTPHAEVRGALRVDALCALGRSAQARGEAQLLLRRHPGSNVARHAVTVCAED